jgi:hypothetical protein
MEVVAARQLQLGDIGGHFARALAIFPFPGIAQKFWNHYFIRSGKPQEMPFRQVLMPSHALRYLERCWRGLMSCSWAPGSRARFPVRWMIWQPDVQTSSVSMSMAQHPKIILPRRLILRHSAEVRCQNQNGRARNIASAGIRDDVRWLTER